jgi:hypothetical protein
MPDIRELIGKEVEVTANGMAYRGTLVEVSDSEVHLKTMQQWVALPAAQVTAIRLRETATSAAADAIEVREMVGDWQLTEESDQAKGS